MKFLVLMFVIGISSISVAADADQQLREFAYGKWQLSGGECLSGAPVYWGGDFNRYTITMELDRQMTVQYRLNKDGKLSSESSGSFGVHERNLYLNFTQHCRYPTDGISECEGTSTPSPAEGMLMSIQRDQLWLLSNQGALGGSCPAQDIFVMKFIRR